MNSLELTRHLYKNGLIKKEAAVKILKKRDDLIKKAMEKEADAFFKTAIFRRFPKAAPSGKAAIQQVKKVHPTVPQGSSLFHKSLQNLLPLAGLAGLAAMGSAAAKYVATTAADTKLKHDVQKSYGKMFEQYPELKDSRDSATQHFNVMAKFAPSLASNPLVAGTFVKGTMGMGHIGPDTVRMLIDAQRSWEDIRERRSPITGLTEALPQTGKMVELAVKSTAGVPEK